MELIGVVLNCPAWFDEAKRLLDWGFGNFSMETAAEAGETAGRAKVLNGRESAVLVCAEETLAYPVCGEDQWSVETVIDEPAEAPVKAGDVLGYMALHVNGEEKARTNLTACADVGRRTLWGTIRGWLSFLPFFGRN